MTLKKKIKKRLGVFEFKKYGGFYIKHLEGKYYFIFKVEKIFNSDMLKEPEAIGKEYLTLREHPYQYDVLFDLTIINKFDDSNPYFDDLRSLCAVTDTSPRNWVRWDDNVEDSIVEDIYLKFKSYCIDGFLDKKERSMYDFSIQCYKKSKPYIWWPTLLWTSQLACNEDRFKEAWFWYEVAVDNYYKDYQYFRYGIDQPYDDCIYETFNCENIDIKHSEKLISNRLTEIMQSKVMSENEIECFLEHMELLSNQSGDGTMCSAEE